MVHLHFLLEFPKLWKWLQLLSWLNSCDSSGTSGLNKISTSHFVQGKQRRDNHLDQPPAHICHLHLSQCINWCYDLQTMSSSWCMWSPWPSSSPFAGRISGQRLPNDIVSLLLSCDLSNTIFFFEGSAKIWSVHSHYIHKVLVHKWLQPDHDFLCHFHIARPK